MGPAVHSGIWKRWHRYAQAVGGSWRCDETYIKVKGRWTYLYRAVDKQGRSVDCLLTAKRDVAAAKRFFQKATNGNGTPRVITLDAYAATHRALRELKAAGKTPKRVRGRSCGCPTPLEQFSVYSPAASILRERPLRHPTGTSLIRIMEFRLPSSI